MNPVWKDRAQVFWKEWGKPFLMVAIVVVSFRSAVADWNDVPTGSMKPTILEGDRIFVNKMAYGLRVPLTSMRVLQWDGPQRGDIVVCFSPHDGIRLVKRCVGVPGDLIEYKNGSLIINGKAMECEESDSASVPTEYIADSTKYRYETERLGERNHLIMIHRRSSLDRPFGPKTLGDDEYFMMGDNRDESFDSRYFGVVKRDAIVGQAKGVALSLNPEHFLSPRWDRFFKSLQ